MRLSRRTFTLSAAALPLVKPGVSMAQPATATPAASPASTEMERVELAAASSRITSLGQFVPGGQLDGALSLDWIDAERQLFHVARDMDDDDRLTAFMQSQFGSGPSLLTTLLELENEIGFGYLDIRQGIGAQQPPNYLQMFQLRFDVAQLPAIWEQAGYAEKEGKFGSYWTIGENGEVDLKNPIQEMAVASLNNVALLNDRSIAFAPTSALLEKVMATASGDSPSILDGLAPVTEGLPETAISAMCLDGSFVSFALPEHLPEMQVDMIEDLLAESDDAVGAMPPVRTICAGTTQGAATRSDFHDPDSTTYAILEVEGDAETAGEVVAWRHENMISMITAQTYSEILGDIEIEVLGDTVLRIESHDGALGAAFTRMIVNADTLLFSYGN